MAAPSASLGPHPAPTARSRETDPQERSWAPSRRSDSRGARAWPPLRTCAPSLHPGRRAGGQGPRCPGHSPTSRGRGPGAGGLAAGGWEAGAHLCCRGGPPGQTQSKTAAWSAGSGSAPGATETAAAAGALGSRRRRVRGPGSCDVTGPGGERPAVGAALRAGSYVGYVSQRQPTSVTSARQQR